MPNIAEKRQNSLHLRTLLYRFKFSIFCRPYFLILLRLYDLLTKPILGFCVLFVFVCLFVCLLFNSSYIHRIEFVILLIYVCFFKDKYYLCLR